MIWEAIMNKREQIISSSIEVFVEYGFHGAPITKLIKSIGVSNGTFFYYFKTKEELITAIYVEIKKELYASIYIDESSSVPIKKGLRELWKNWVLWARDNEMKFKFIEIFANSPFVSLVDKEEMQKAYMFIGSLLKRGIEEEVLIDLDVKLISGLIYGSIRATILYNQNYKKQSDDELVHVFDLMWKSIVSF